MLRFIQNVYLRNILIKFAGLSFVLVLSGLIFFSGRFGVNQANGQSNPLIVNGKIGGAPTGVVQDNLDTLTKLSTSVYQTQTGLKITLSGAHINDQARPYLSGGNGKGFGPNGTDQPDGQDSTTYIASYRSTTPDIDIALPEDEKYFGILWGSVDPNNKISFYENTTLVGSVKGSDISSNIDFGNQGSNGTYYVNIGSTQAFNHVKLNSCSSGCLDSFEFDNLAYGTAIPWQTVPCVVDTLPSGINYLSGSSSPVVGPTCTGGSLAWDAVLDGAQHTITYSAKIPDDYCNTHGSGPIGANSVLLTDSNGNTIAGPTTDQTSQSAINVTCPINVKGDVGGASLGGQIKVNGPSVIVSSGQVPTSIKGSGDIKSFDGYNLGSLSTQISAAANNFLSLANNEGLQFDFNTYDLNPTNKPDGGIVVNSGTMYLNKSLNKSGVLINKTGDIQINAGFANSLNSTAGIVALQGNIIINNTNGMNIQDVGLFAPNGKIIINNNNSLLNWTGFMVAKDIVVNQGAGSKGGNISWSGKIAQNPLPGFKNLLNAISVSEVAPQ